MSNKVMYGFGLGFCVIGLLVSYAFIQELMMLSGKRIGSQFPLIFVFTGFYCIIQISKKNTHQDNYNKPNIKPVLLSLYSILKFVIFALLAVFGIIFTVFIISKM